MLRRSADMFRWVKRLKLKVDGYWTKRALCIGLGVFLINILLHPHSLARSYDYIAEEDMKLFLSNPNAASHKQPCSYKGHKVKIHSVLEEIKSKDFSLDDRNLRTIWKKTNCTPHRVAVIVPYRDRQEQLKIFLEYMHWFLQEQLLDYHIYIVEQNEQQDFNRALLFNIGYTEAKKRDEIPCFIFHDVDLLPENTGNIYACTTCPRHLSACVNTLRYTLIYNKLFGGAVAMLSEQFELVNGFSNRYFGWGGEDDDMSSRIVNKNLKACRFSPALSRYTMLPHKPATPNAKRHSLLKRVLIDQEIDGLNDITSKYKLVETENRLRHTRFHVEIL